jgi:hypothetical protein
LLITLSAAHSRAEIPDSWIHDAERQSRAYPGRSPESRIRNAESAFPNIRAEKPSPDLRTLAAFTGMAAGPTMRDRTAGLLFASAV